ncbi:extracellular solute-binding protein [Actinomadura syzygii]|nr:extracellular solute-binding protein [Actinomadura syzygii]
MTISRRTLAVAVASLVAVAPTWLVMDRVAGVRSAEPGLGCGEHNGLVIGVDSDVSLGFQRRGLLKLWNQWHGSKVTLMEVGLKVDQQRSQLAAAAQARSCLYDVLILDTPGTAEFAEGGHLEPIKSTWMEDPDDFFDPPRESGKWQGKQYAVPWTTDAGLLYVKGKGKAVPGSWEALVNAGYATQLVDYEGLTVNALDAVWNRNEQQRRPPVLMGTDTKVTVDDARESILPGLRDLKAGLEHQRARAGAGGMAKDPRTSDELDSIEMFAQAPDGTVMRNWPFVFRSLFADPRVRDRFEVSRLPAPGLSVLGGQNLAVSAYSRHKEEAGELVYFLTGKTSENRLFVCGGYPPTRKSALNDNPCQEQGARLEPEEQPTPERRNKFIVELKAAMEKAHPRPITPHYSQFSETFRGCADAVLDSGPDAPEPSPEKLAEALNASLRGEHGSC